VVGEVEVAVRMMVMIPLRRGRITGLGDGGLLLTD
jgi:hypothetical protein